MPWIRSPRGNRLTHLGICSCLLFVFACSSSNSEAPAPTQGHEDTYITKHSAQAADDMDRCRKCHGSDLNGKTRVTGCFTCHANGMPIALHSLPFRDPGDHGAAARRKQKQCLTCHGAAPNLFDGGVLADPALYNIASANCSASQCHQDAGAHPTRWQGGNDITSDYISSHRSTSAESIQVNCALCHQVTKGGAAPLPKAPSCFSADFTNGDNATTSCHPGGAQPSHDLPYTSPSLHGGPAKADLAGCQTCHGEPGTIRFDGGSAPTGCSSQACHPDAGAHSTNWRSGHDSAGRKDSSCTICHDVTQGRQAPDDQAPSCFSTDFTNSNNINGSCHPGGVTPDHGLPYASSNLHGGPAKADLGGCQSCHGEPGTIRFDGGSAPTACSSQACHPDADAHPTNWRSGHDSAGRKDSTCTICHDVTQGRQAPNSQAPSCFSTDFTNSNNINGSCHPGGVTPDHGLPYASSNLHGGPAKSDLTDCQSCHGDPGTIRFDGGSAPTACSSQACHPDAGAHPTNWEDGHRSSRNRSNSCSLCHDVTRNRPAPHNDAPSCYAEDFTNSNNIFSECH